MSEPGNGRRQLVLPILVSILATALLAGVPAWAVALRAPTATEIQEMIDRSLAPVKKDVAALEVHRLEVDQRFDQPQDTRLDELSERLARLEALLRLEAAQGTRSP